MTTERGAGTVLTVTGLAALMVVLVGAVAVAAAVEARHRAEAGADLAALAAAQQWVGGGSNDQVCEAANRVAAANQGRLAGCVTEGETVLVRVRVVVRSTVPLVRGRYASAVARAGPAP